MGFYINPKGDKEDWLNLYGSAATIAECEGIFASESEDEELPVCLIDNGSFKAAGICYCQEEFDIFVREDGRQKSWFIVGREDLSPYYPENA